ncbi:tetratricopeptide repeat protein [Buchnera aphidicola (Thelaxes californica)]|uniref:Tetratricopeptide repeat protein n=1 Tax=Buchnera aphidicola (Thelaxes californica) TaxID=1315998 RepID=A0A4D6YL55_9GAMM|nr:tetratricopeptide repeat protein [Buchnera aphidicola]QCI26690.1 tetratricopeptide repeat protein [Buchnera aphidicola (Thelaxes californica)]
MKLLIEKIKLNQSSILDSILEVLSFIKDGVYKNVLISEFNEKIKSSSGSLLNDCDSIDKLRKMLDIFYVHWKFGSAYGTYKISNILYLDEVLKTKQGSALSLGIILIYVAKQFNINLDPIIFPTQLILSYFCKKTSKVLLINPFDGEFLDKNILTLWLQGNITPTATIQKNNLKIADNFTVICNFLHTLKLSLIEEKNMVLALKVSDVLIKIKPEDPYEIRDRGLIYAYLECDNVAVSDLMQFIERCPHDPVSEILKMQIYVMQKKSVILH